MRPPPTAFSISERELDEKLELLQQLSLEDEAQRWFQDESDWPQEDPSDYVPYGHEEYNADACEACVYDPYLFSPSNPRTYPVGFPNRDKPLPAPPSTPIIARSPYTTPLPSPLTDSFSWSTPSASSVPSLSRSSSIRTRPIIRSRSPSFSSVSRSIFTHSTLPSISSTLSNLQEQEFDIEKSSAIWAMELRFNSDLRSEGSQESTILAHTPVRRSSREALRLTTSFSEALNSRGASSQLQARPTTPSLTASASSPALRTLAALASIPPSPIRAIAPPPAFLPAPRFSGHNPSRSNTQPLPLVTDLSSTPFHSTIQPVQSNPVLAPGNPMLASRWSLDTTAPLEPSRHQGNKAAAEPPAVPEVPRSPKTRKRDRLLSFISRSRAGSVGKSSAPVTESDSHHEHRSESTTSSRRSSRFAGVHSPSAVSLPLPANARMEKSSPPPLPIAPTNSFNSSPASTTTSCSVSTVATPVDGPDVSSDEDHSLINKFDNTSYFVDEDDNTPPSPPLLPLPDPNTPAVSFLFPTRPSTKIPILSTLSLRRKARRKRELVISDAPFLKPIERPSPEMRQDDRAMSEYDRRVQERDRRYNAILKWLRRFGTVRQVEQQSDGSLVVSWKDWDVADRACRVQAQVSIRGVGTVALSWRYMK